MITTAFGRLFIHLDGLNWTIVNAFETFGTLALPYGLSIFHRDRGHRAVIRTEATANTSIGHIEFTGCSHPHFHELANEPTKEFWWVMLGVDNHVFLMDNPRGDFGN